MLGLTARRKELVIMVERMLLDAARQSAWAAATGNNAVGRGGDIRPTNLSRCKDPHAATMRRREGTFR
uniref:Uncharacterized protein n=1 Tax=Aromatoleum buckelii TaxID=200254 RepID=A0ABX1MY70_9RHOO